MQEKHLYEYAVILVVARVEREEFLNVDCSFVKAKFIKMIYTVNEAKFCFLLILSVSSCNTI
jgi:hypothetical protein